jgi:hypothetical protein
MQLLLDDVLNMIFKRAVGGSLRSNPIARTETLKALRWVRTSWKYGKTGTTSNVPTTAVKSIGDVQPVETLQER